MIFTYKGKGPKITPNCEWNLPNETHYIVHTRYSRVWSEQAQAGKAFF